MHSSNSFPLPILWITLCKKVRHIFQDVAILYLFYVASVLWLRIRSCCCNWAVLQRAFRCLGQLREWQDVVRWFPWSDVWVTHDHLNFIWPLVVLSGGCSISFQCLSPLCLASLCWNLADPHWEYTIRSHSFQALNTETQSENSYHSSQILSGPQVTSLQKMWEIPLLTGCWGCWNIVPWPISLQCNMRQHATYIPSCKIRRSSLYEADPSLNQRLLGTGDVFGHVSQDGVACKNFTNLKLAAFSRRSIDCVTHLSTNQGQSANCKAPCWSEQVIWSSQHASGPCWKELHQKSHRQNMVSVVMQLVCGLAIDDSECALRSGVGHGHRLDRIFPNLLCSMEDLQRPHLPDMKSLTLWLLCLQKKDGL